VDFLKSVAGMFTASVLRLAVTVGILAAVYFFAIRPVLDTTNKAIDSASSYSSGVHSDIGRQIQRSIRQTNRQVQRQVRRSFKQTPSQKNQKRLLHCVQRANGNVNRIQRCSKKF
jgi:maltooligosyltrehalose synthase